MNDFIAKAAERALQDVTANKSTAIKKKAVVYGSNASSFNSDKYTGGDFK